MDISFMPPSWDGDVPRTHPPTAHFVRYENPRRPGADRPDWLDGARDAPLVLASLGTVMHREPGLLEAIIEALADEPIGAVVAIGRDQDPARFGTPPPNVRLERYVPQIPVLEACDAFVTHGGFNSAKEALSLGVPLVSIPIGGDQPYCAQRVEALGLGRRVGPEERTAQVIRDRAREVLSDPGYRKRAEAFAEEMRSLPPVSDLVQLLERLAVDHRPIRRV
jgi:N-glycosyltransferase